jgi:ankyrin repeat protein
MQFNTLTPFFASRLSPNSLQDSKSQGPYVALPLYPFDRLELSNKANGLNSLKSPQPNFSGRTPSHEHVTKNNLERLKQRINAIPNDLKAQDQYGDCPLHIAVTEGHTDIVRFILTLPNVSSPVLKRRAYDAMIESLSLKNHLELDADSCYDGETPGELAKSLSEADPADSNKKEIYNLFRVQKGLPRVS